MATKSEVWKYLERVSQKRLNDAREIIRKTPGGWMWVHLTRDNKTILKRCEQLGYQWNFDTEQWEHQSDAN